MLLSQVGVPRPPDCTLAVHVVLVVLAVLAVLAGTLPWPPTVLAVHAVHAVLDVLAGRSTMGSARTSSPSMVQST
jgi:hypothetical protein